MEYTIHDKIWVLGETANRGGFMPHGWLTVQLLQKLGREGLVVCDSNSIIWHITDAGREWLKNENSAH